MRKVLCILLFTIILIGGIAGLWFYNSVMYLATYQSPNGNYELVIKRNRSIFAPTSPGDGGTGSTPVEVILKNANGKIIGTSSSNKNCDVLYDSIDVRWDIKNEEVWYSRAKTIHLKTGKVTC